MSPTIIGDLSVLQFVGFCFMVLKFFCYLELACLLSELTLLLLCNVSLFC